MTTVTLTKDDFNFKMKRKVAFGNEDLHVAAIFLDKDDRNEPFIVLLFHAIMAFRRLIKKFMRRKYVLQITKDVRRGDNPLRLAINSSNSDLIRSRGRAAVMDFDVMNEAITSSAAEISRKEKWERNLNNYIQKKKRVSSKKGHRNKKPNISTINVLKQIQHAHKLEKGTINFAHTLEKMETSSIEEVKKESFSLANTLLMNPKYAPSHTEKGPKFSIADVDAIQSYLPGAPIYYGATIGIQARHGGYLSYFNSNDIKASAFKPTAQARYVIINCDRREDTGIVRYGDSVWLQVGYYEILGARFGIRKKKYYKGETEEMNHSLMPAFINCRNDNLHRAMSYGRWIIMCKTDSIGKQGQPVCHHDQVLFEQEWYYLSSARPSEASMFRCKGADHLNNEKELSKYLFRPAEECSWKMHIIGQATEKSDKKQLEKIFSKANKQIDAVAENVSKKAPAILSHVQTKIADHLKPEVFLVDHLKHKTDNVETQVQYYDVYQKLSSKNFSNLQAKVYGKDSNIAQYSKIADNYKKQKAGLEIEDDQEEKEPKTNQDILNERYWDAANQLLVPCASALQLQGFMDEYFEIDHRKKYMAGMVIKRVLMRKINSRFNFSRALNKNDVTVQNQLYDENYATAVLQQAGRMKLENTDSNDEGPLKLKRSISPDQKFHSSTKIQQNQSPIRPYTATFRRMTSMQETVPDYQYPIARPRSATVLNQRESLIRPASASAIGRSIITSPMSTGGRKVEKTNPKPNRVHSAPATRQNELPQTENAISDKSMSKKDSMRRLVKKVGREYGLPVEIFEGKQYSNNTLKDKGKIIFLSKSASAPDIYSDQKKKGINWKRKL